MPVTLTLDPGGPSKRDIILMAFEDCGRSGFEFEVTPDEVTSALRKLNAMMWEFPWNALGYSQPTYGQGLPEDESGIPTNALNAVASYLALRLAPSMGKTLAPEQRANLARSHAQLCANYATLPDMSRANGTIRGAGAEIEGPFFPEAA